jgi:hypothetical protein
LTAGEKTVRVVDLFPVFRQGEIRYTAWPAATAALIAQALARVGAVEPRKLVLYGCGLAGLAVLFLALSGDRHGKRR